MDMVKRNRTTLIIIQVVVTLLLLLLLIFKTKNLTNREISLNEFVSDYITYDATNNCWQVFDNQLGETIRLKLLSSSNIECKAGSYTLSVEYNAEKQQHFSIGQVNPTATFVHGNTFFLSKNKHLVEYDFYVTEDVDDLVMYIDNFDGGYFSLNKILLKENNHNYRMMLFCWIIISILIDLFFFIKKDTINKIILPLVIVAMVPSLILFMPGFGVYHDYAFHMHRIESVAEGLKLLTFPVKLYTTVNDGLGYPAGVYYGDLLLYIPAVLRVIGFSITTVFKIYIIIVNILTSFTCFYCAYSISKNRKASIIATLAYVTCSYRLLDIYVRFALGEYTALIFYPLIFLAIWNIYHPNNEKLKNQANHIILAIGMSGLIYTHILSVEIVCLSIALVCLVKFKKTFTIEVLLTYLKAVGLTILLCLAFIIPFLDYYKHSNTAINYSGSSVAYIQKQGAYISDYFAFFKNYYGRSSADVTLHMQLTPGLVLMSVLILAAYIIVKGLATKEIKVLFSVAILTLFISSAFFPWNYLANKSKIFNLIATVQFPWRFLSITILVLSILFVFIANFLSDNPKELNRLYSVTVVASVIMMSMFISNSQDTNTQKYYVDKAELPYYTYSFNYGDDALGVDEYLPSGTDLTVINYATVSNGGQVEIVGDRGLEMLLSVNVGDNAYIEIPRFYFPNYIATTITGESIAIVNGDNNLVRLMLPYSYNGLISIKYVEPVIWRVSEIISIITLIILIVYLKVKKLKFV